MKPNSLRYYIITVLGAFILSTLLSFSSLSYSISNTTSDLIYKRPAAADSRIKIIGIDEESVAQIGDWPWSYDKVAELIDILAEGEAAVIGVNAIFLSSSGNPQSDLNLSQSMENAGNVVIPTIFNQSGVGLGGQYLLYPFDAVKKASTQGVKINVLDNDGVLRRAFINGALTDSIDTQSFSFAVYEMFMKNTGQAVAFDTSTLVNGQMVVDFTGGNTQFEVIPAHEIFSGTVHNDYFKGSIVLVGDWTAQAERYYTPYDRSNPTFDIAVEVNIIQQLINGRTISITPFWIVMMITLVLAFVTALLITKFNPYVVVGMVVIVGIFVLNISWLAYIWFGMKTTVFEPILTMMFALIIGTSYILVEERIRWTDQFLSSFIDVMITQIETKTKYNADHTNRVKPLALQIAKHVKGLSKNSIAALGMASSLHDIGKISVPTSIMNKVTRLGERASGVFSRIHLFRAQELSSVTDNMNPDEMQLPDAANKIKIMIAEINHKYDRYHDVVAKLDNPEHYPNADDMALVFEMAAITIEKDQTLIRLLEDEDVERLQINKGTLSEEERRIMEKHVEFTRKFLSHIEFEGMYQNVPDIAVKHHEKLNGTGYPDRLTEEYIQVEARILSVADIIDALLAKDRPYKKIISIQECANILNRMADDGEIDKNIVKVIIDNKILEWYEETFEKSDIN